MQALAIDLERSKGELAAHEDICSERYRGIVENQGDVKRALESINTRLGTISDAQVASAAVAAAALVSGRPKWWQQVLAAAVVGLIGWMASTIWSMENAKVDAAQNHPGATVTVNPPQAVAPPVVPAASSTAPLPSNAEALTQ